MAGSHVPGTPASGQSPDHVPERTTAAGDPHDSSARPRHFPALRAAFGIRPGPRSSRGLRTGLIAVAATALVVAAVAFGGNAYAATLFTDDFEDGNSTGWAASGGSWSVGSDGTQVLRQTGTSSDARNRAGSAGWTDYAVTARIRPTAVNGANRFVAVLARAQSNTSYYYLALRTNNTVELKKLVGGSSTTLATAAVTVAVGTWYTLRLDVAGSTLRGSVNGAANVQATDTQFATGNIGVATFNAAASFDDIVVDTSAPPTTTPSTVRPSTSPPVTTPPVTTPPVTTPPVTTGPAANQADGFAGVNAMGQNGTSGGAGGTVVTVSTTDQLLTAIDTVGVMTIQVQGTINITSKQGVRPNKTIIGLGSNATINGGGFDFYKSYNVIVRNLTFTNADDDAVNIGQNSHHVWIDHNTFRSPADGSVDYVRGADYVTISWNWFDHTDKTMLISHSDSNAGEDTGHLKVSIHHNFFDNSRQRHPRVRFAEPVHVYNNYFLANELYGAASTENGGILLEGNYFESVPFPCFSASGYAESGPGRLVERANMFVNSGPCETSGSVAEPRTYYPYTLDSAANVPSRVRAGAGAGHL